MNIQHIEAYCRVIRHRSVHVSSDYFYLVNLDREWIDQVIWDSIWVASRVNTHGDKFTLIEVQEHRSFCLNGNVISMHGAFDDFYNLGKINKMKAFTSGVPVQISLMWSQMALAADMALDSFRALMTAAPLCCTVCSPGIKKWSCN